MYLRHTHTLAAVAAAVTVLLSACGGGGGSNDDEAPGPGTPPVTPTPEPTVSVTGFVLDGGIDNAIACLDVNNNRSCDADEPQARTAGGQFDIASNVGTDHIVLIQAGTDAKTADGPVAAPYVLTAPLGRHATITPFTTLLQSEVDSGRAANLTQAEGTLLSFLVGSAGQVGGIQLYDNYLPLPDTESTLAQTKMLTLGQLLTRGFAETSGMAGLDAKAAFAAYGQAASGSLQQVLYPITAPLDPVQRESLFASVKDSLVATPQALAAVAKAAAKTQAEAIEGAWIKTSGTGKEVYVFAGDGTFVHQFLQAPSSTDTAFDNGLGYRYGRYSISGGTIAITLLESANSSGPANGVQTFNISGNAMNLGGSSLTRVASASNALVGGWVRPNGLSTPEYMVIFEDGTYAHGTFYYQNDRQTGTATALETARNVGLQIGSYTVNAANADVIDFGETTVDFNGALSVPSNPGVAHLQNDGSISLFGLRLVKLGSAQGAKAVTGFSEATRSRIWSLSLIHI